MTDSRVRAIDERATTDSYARDPTRLIYIFCSRTKELKVPDDRINPAFSSCHYTRKRTWQVVVAARGGQYRAGEAIS